MTKDQIIAALPTLKQEDLLAIKAVTTHLLQQGHVDPSVGANEPQAWLVMAIQRVLGSRYVPPTSMKSLQQNSVAFMEFTNQHFNGVLVNRTAALAVMFELIKLVAADLKDKKVPVTYKTIIDSIPRIHDIFDRAFPGYLDSNLAGLFMAGMRK